MVASPDRSLAFPLGAALTLAALDEHPHEKFDEMRSREPVSWAPCLQAWVLTRHEDIAKALCDSEVFSVADPRSLLNQIFGPQILSLDGAAHERYRRSLLPPFTPKSLRETMAERVKVSARDMIGALAGAGEAEWREAFAAQYPIRNALDLFGLAAVEPQQMRIWYDRLEAALSNFAGDPSIAQAGRESAAAFLRTVITHVDQSTSAGLINLMRAAGWDEGEIGRNSLTIFFGGISTVEALILNAVWILCAKPEIRMQVERDRALIKPLLEETMRWASPVQTSIRIATRPVQIAGVEIAAGERIACMLGAANRDPALWDRPHEIDLNRANLARHIGFSTGKHFCIGSHLARLEAEAALSAMLDLMPGFQFAGAAPRIEGYEFRQPRSLPLVWTAKR